VGDFTVRHFFLKPCHIRSVETLAEIEINRAVPGSVVMELVQDAQNAGEVRQALQLVAPLRVVWPTEADCTRALPDFAAYHLSHGFGLWDAWIAVCAVSLSARLCTFNVKHYQVVPGLVTAQPYTR